MMFEFWVLYKFYWSSGSRLRHTDIHMHVRMLCTKANIAERESNAISGMPNGEVGAGE